MNWIESIGVGLLAAPVAGLIAGTAATVAAEWAGIEPLPSDPPPH